MLKSIVELLEELPEPYRTQALLNMMMRQETYGKLFLITL